MKIAVQGCAHGDLDDIYASVRHIEETENVKVDLLISCGDFQAVRNESDLDSMAVPQKYKQLGCFHKYYSGEMEAPYPTLFIGGNHEASNYLWELYYGGYVAPKMYYLGYSGVVNFGGLRIGGISGIFDKRNFRYGHFEFPPYDRGTVRSVYHVREYEVRKLLQVKGKLDIFLSHDWPRGVANCGHCDRLNLFRLKPYFKDEIMRDELGSPAAAQLCNRLRPSYWFSAHYHVKFPALIHHSKSMSEHTVTAREGESEKVGQQQEGHTKFLALDKCLPRREYLQILDFPDSESPKEFQYDVEWLAILKKLHAEMPLERRQVSCQTDESSCQGVSEDEIAWVTQKLGEISNHIIPNNFQPIAPAQVPYRAGGCMREAHYVNPQTLDTLRLLELPYVLDLRHHQQQQPSNSHQGNFNGGMHSAQQQQQQDENPEEIDIDLDEDDVGNPEEIEI